MSVKQRTAIKFCVLTGVSKYDTVIKIQQTYGEAAMKKTAIYKWLKRFEEGETDTSDQQRTGRSTSWTSRDVVSIKALDDDRRITIREIKTRVECSHGTIHNIIRNELKMRCLCASWIPKC